MNRNRMLIVAIVALILSGGTAYLAWRVMRSRVTPREETTQILVAARKLDLGARLTKEDVRLSNWPAATPMQGSFSEADKIVGRGVIVAMMPNEPVLDSKLAPMEAGAGLTAVIPDGMRAISIPVNVVIGVSGFVLPGSRVDLILTGVPPDGVKGAKANEMASKIILENLQVLAVGQNVQQDAQGKPQTVQVVTLLVTPEQSEKIALAHGEGRIQLALRNPLDIKAVDPALVTRTALYSPGGVEEALPPAKKSPTRKASAPKVTQVSKPVPPPPAVAPELPSRFTVEVIQGTRRGTVTFDEENQAEPKKP
jgi:pilus assembly protein CpaB